MLQFLHDFKHFTTVKYYDELLHKVKIYHVNTLQQLHAQRRSVMDAIKTMWERRVDAVGTLTGRCVHAITGNFDMFRRILRRSHSALTIF